MTDSISRDRSQLAFREQILMAAHRLASAGYRVFPCLPWSKSPATEHGFKDASTEPSVINGWFANDLGRNLAIACGPQPNDVFLYVVDVDPDKGGSRTWADLVAEGGIPMTPRQETPHDGGFHLFFDAPGLGNSQGGLGPGVDTRGDGGYVVVAPSRLRDENGEILVYRWRGDLIANRPIPVPDHLRPQEQVAPSVARHPSSGRDVLGFFQPWQYVNDHFSCAAVLVDHGWVQVGRGRFVRPGKNPRDGHSAEVHDDRQVTVFTSEIPPELFNVGLPARSGFRSFTTADLILGYRFGGEKVAFERWARESFGPAAPARVDGPDRGLSAGPRAVEPAPGGDGTSPPLFLEAAWYEQRPWMQACLQMAQAVGGSPSAHLLAFLTRAATAIPPGYCIPPINGAPSSFDLLGVIAGSSGSGKTSPMANAEYLVPLTGRKDLRLGLGIGSGEGIIESYYALVDVASEDGKNKRRERRKVFNGVHFSVSEGLIFAELAGRGGTTHVTRLCDGWSGAPLSTANASAETFRHIDRHQYRLTLVMGIQADMAHELMNDSSASQGFVGRLLFAWAEEPRVSPRPAFPEPPEILIPTVTTSIAGVFQPRFLAYPEQVYAEIQGASDARVGTKVPVEEHHHDLLRCKIAGVVALLDGRTDVSMDDWAIATDLVSISSSIRRYLYEHRRQAERDRRHTQAVVRAEVELVVEDVKERRAIASMAENIKRKVSVEPWGRNKLAREVAPTKTRHRFDAALALAIANGWVTESEGRITTA